MTPDQLLQKTRLLLPQFVNATIDLINTGGSDRKFYRLTTSEKNSIVLVHYSDLKEENKHYASHAVFLKNHSLNPTFAIESNDFSQYTRPQDVFKNTSRTKSMPRAFENHIKTKSLQKFITSNCESRVNIPEVIAHSAKDGLLWLEDLGSMDLWSQREKSWQERRPLYESTLTQIAHFHCIPIDAPAKAGIVLQKEFNEELYQWEQDYFFEHGLGGLFNIDHETRRNIASSPSLKNLARSLAALPRQLIHRDLQSQNVMLHAGKTWLIDFQGLRLGLAAYDLASLLYDPYVTLSEKERDHLFYFYQEEMKRHGILLPPDAKKIFFQCAAQRLMQALGAYGFISLKPGKAHYRAYAAPALTRLREVLTKLEAEDQLDELAALLAEI